MCIIVYKPIGVKLPSKKTLHNCYENNSDGCGFAIKRNNKILYRKGTMTFDNFWNILQSYKLTKNDEILLHFRIATAGKINNFNCQPFSISSEVNKVKNVEGKSNFVMTHNGHINLKLKHDLSDSGMLANQFFSKMSVYDIYVNKLVREEIEKFLSFNKIALLHNKFGFTKFGDFIEDHGVLYSDNTYKTEYFDRWFYNKYESYLDEKWDDEKWDCLENKYKTLDKEKIMGYNVNE